MKDISSTLKLGELRSRARTVVKRGAMPSWPVELSRLAELGLQQCSATVFNVAGQLLIGRSFRDRVEELTNPKYRDWLWVQEIERLEKEQTEEHKQWLKIPREERLREKRELGGELRLGLDGINPVNEDFYYEAEVIGRSISSLIMCPHVFWINFIHVFLYVAGRTKWFGRQQ